MPLHQFFHIFANVPLGKRTEAINFNKHGPLTLQDIYRQLQELEDRMRPLRMQQEHLLQIAERHWINTGVL